MRRQHHRTGGAAHGGRGDCPPPGDSGPHGGLDLASRGLEFTVDGNLNVHDRGVIATVDPLEEISLDGHTTGAVDWELDDRSGTCMIDMERNTILDLSGSEPTGTGTDAGMMCGMAIELTTGNMSVGG